MAHSAESPRDERAADAPGTLEIYLLGRTEVLVDGERVPEDRWLRRASRRLVTLLAVEPLHALHREQAAETLWPDSGPRSAANNLHKAVHAARRALEPGLDAAERSRFLKTTDQQIVLAAPRKLWVDAEAFRRRAEAAVRGTSVERYRLARSLYRGELLADDPYEDWIEAPRSHLRDLYSELLRGLARLHDARGEFELSVQVLLELLSRDPSNEAAHRLLMLVYARMGNRDQSFRQFVRCRDALREHLAIRPDRETVDLYEKILSGAVEPAPRRAARGRAPRDGPAEPVEPLRHNLPRFAARFVGREAQVETVRSIVRSSALLTLVGPGGIGKTRLAVEAASGLVDELRDGVWFVELAGLDDDSHLVGAVASTFGVREKPKQTPLDSLVEFLRPRSVLLVLDGGEHLIDACAGLIEEVLTRCPEARALFTSREALRLPGEHVWQVLPLDVPESTRDVSAARALDFDAIRLFVERARQADPEFALSDRTAPLAAEICRRVDGLPLAVELAAARLSVLSIEQILDRLSDRLRVLEMKTRGGAARHHTLRAMIDWSHALLSPEEKLLFHRAAAFSGSWSLEAAEAVCAGSAIDSDDVLELLARLVAKSLVTAASDGAGVRYRMLETVRYYALGKLEESGESGEIRSRHRAWFARLAEEAETAMKGPELDDWLARLDAEHENVRAALRHREGSEPDDTALKICVRLMRFWTVRGHWSEGIASIEAGVAAIDGTPPSPARAQALYIAGTLARLQTDCPKARGFLTRSLDEWRALGGAAGTASALNQLGFVALSEGDNDTAESFARRALETYSACGDRFGAALVLIQLANVAAERDRLPEAREYLESSLAYFREVDDRLNTGIVLHTLGEIAQREGDHASAERHFVESLATTDRLGYKLLQALSAVSLGYVVVRLGDFDRARALFERAFRLATEIGDRETSINAVEGFAAVSIADGNPREGLRLGAAAERRRAERGIERYAPYWTSVEALFERARGELSRDEAEEAEAEGRSLDLESLSRGPDAS